MKGYGSFIKKHRTLSGYKSQRALGEKTGISHATISRIEKEEQSPELRTLEILALYLSTTSLKELMDVCGIESEKMKHIGINERIKEIENALNEIKTLTIDTDLPVIFKKKVVTIVNKTLGE